MTNKYNVIRTIRAMRWCFAVLITMSLLMVPTPVEGVEVSVPVPDAEEAGAKAARDIPRLDAKIKVDGVLSEEVWKNALKMELNYEVQPGENIKPPVKTIVYIYNSKSHFNVGFRCFDPDPNAIRARFSDRDKLWADDWVAVVLDTFNDQRKSYMFVVNPYGVQAEMVESIAGVVNLKWDTIWDSAGHMDDQGYTVEFSIPFSSMRFQNKEGAQTWGFDAVRKYPRALPHIIGLFPRDRNSNCYACQMVKVKGFEGAKPGRNIEIAPTLSVFGSQEREEFIEGKFVEKDSKLDPGVSFQWGITPNMSLNATINPDFSHVEADAALLDINTQFALQYAEKRPFFLEGSDLFLTRLNVIYTRALADPKWGIKLTGKDGVNDIGLFSAQDRITNLVFPGSYGSRSTSLGMDTVGSVLRYRRDIGKVSTLGLLVTDREGKDYFNRVAGVDGYLRLTQHKEVRLQFVASQTRYPGEVAADYNQPDGKFTGTALELFLRHSSRNFYYFVIYQQASPDFRADMGFMPQVGYRHLTGAMIFVWYRNPGHWFSSINLIPTVRYETDFDDNLIFKSVKLSSEYKGPLQSEVFLEANLEKRSFLGTEYDTSRLTANFEMQPSGALSLYLNTKFGNQIDYRNARQGKILWLNPGIGYRLGKRFYLSLDHIYERLNVDAGRLYTANVSNLKAIYQFNKRAFFRAILQYVNYDYNMDNYFRKFNPKFEHLFTQLLFSYKLNPRTVLFLGYSDDYYGLQMYPLTQNNRTLFLKIGYAFRM